MEERHQRYSVRRAYASIQIALGITPKRLEKDMRHASMQTAQDLQGYLWSDHEADTRHMRALDLWLEAPATDV